VRAVITACLVALGIAIPLVANAQNTAWPTQPLKFIVSFAPGSTGDISIRKIGPLIASQLGAPSVVVENRTGASGSVGLQAVSNAPADGYTFLIAADIQSSLTPLVPDPSTYFEKHFVPVAPLVFVDMFVAATPSLQANTFAELVALAKANPGKINYGSTGVGSSHQLIMEHLKLVGDFDLFHIPYRSSPVAMPDLASGRIQVMFTALSTGMALVNDNKLKALAVGALERHRQLPNTPTLAESGFPGVEFHAYWSVWAKIGTPAPVVQRLREAVLQATANPEVRTWFASLGMSPFPGGLEGLTSRVKSDREKWATVVAAKKIELPK
jgi:tripartite-type tricarboxylate transporter receptor subunit TctC